jgi:endonuclease YncB( thermonuclease family)
MISLVREMVRAVVMLPLVVKALLGLALIVEFVVVVQWERLSFRQPPTPALTQSPTSPERPAEGSFRFPDVPIPNTADAAAVEAALAKRMAPVTIKEPIVQPNGSITGNGQTLYLYGIKQIDSKKVCTRSSGDRWACGLQVFATLRNSIAKVTIVCEPKKILPNAVAAVCSQGPINIALALVRDGLVEIDENADDAGLVGAQAFAKSKNLGIWDR